jgi:hypothetical protein
MKRRDEGGEGGKNTTERTTATTLKGTKAIRYRGGGSSSTSGGIGSGT